MTPLNFNECGNSQKYIPDFDDMLDDVINTDEEETESTNEDIEESVNNNMDESCPSQVFVSQG